MSTFAVISGKIQSIEVLAKTVAGWRRNGEKIVFTNGCFDILHYGHLHYLAAARDLGDRLIVALNSDDSVRRLKGPSRPIHDAATRTHQLAALSMVDAVVTFEDDTPLALIQAIQPDVLVKGGDWKPEQIVGSDFVFAGGGLVMSLPFVEGYSTTAIEKKIRAQGK
jgi:rfaE bifunctional protein nucleotidyltransferase chain/domain